MITFYGVLLFLHILGAAIWLGGEVIVFGLRALAVRSGDRARAVALARDTDRINMLVISPAVGLLLGAGIWLVLEGSWGFDRFFVIFGLAGVGASSLFGGIVTLPGSRALQRTAATVAGSSAGVGNWMTVVKNAASRLCWSRGLAFWLRGGLGSDIRACTCS